MCQVDSDRFINIYTHLEKFDSAINLLIQIFLNFIYTHLEKFDLHSFRKN